VQVLRGSVDIQLAKLNNGNIPYHRLMLSLRMGVDGGVGSSLLFLLW